MITNNSDIITYTDFIGLHKKLSIQGNTELDIIWNLLFNTRSKVKYEEFKELWALLLWNFNGKLAEGFDHARILTVIIKHLFFRHPLGSRFWKDLTKESHLPLNEFINRTTALNDVIGLTPEILCFFWSWQTKTDNKVQRLDYNALIAMLSLVQNLSTEIINKSKRGGDPSPQSTVLIQELVQIRLQNVVNIRYENDIYADYVWRLRKEKSIMENKLFEANQQISRLQRQLIEFKNTPGDQLDPIKNDQYEAIMKALLELQMGQKNLESIIKSGLANVCQTVINCTKDDQDIPRYVMLIPGRHKEGGMLDYFHSLKAQALDKLELFEHFHLYACDEGPMLLNERALEEPMHDPINIQMPGKTLRAMQPLMQAMSALLVLAKIAGTAAGFGPLFPSKLPGMESLNAMDPKQCEVMANAMMSSAGFIKSIDPDKQIKQMEDAEFTHSALVDEDMKDKAIKLVGGAYRAMKMLLKPKDGEPPKTIVPPEGKGRPESFEDMIGSKIIKIHSPTGSIHWVHPHWVSKLKSKGYLVDDRSDEPAVAPEKPTPPPEPSPPCCACSSCCVIS